MGFFSTQTFFTYLRRGHIQLGNPRSGYVGWGATYGRGLAESEDRQNFKKLLDAPKVKLKTKVEQLYPKIGEAIRAQKLENPIILHSLVFHLSMPDEQGSNKYLPKYHRDCPATSLSEVPGFSGVLLVDERAVPVVSNYVDNETRGTILVTDLQRFARWTQYFPADDPNEEKDVIDWILIRVKDLNRETAVRESILTKDPQWLRSEQDKPRYLRSRVVINVFEKFKVDILDADAAVAIKVTNDR